MKRCSRCKVEKETIGFGKASRETDGYRPECKDCRKAEYAAKAGAVKESRRAYYAANAEAIKDRAKRRHEEHPERAHVHQRKYASAHKTERRAYLAVWRPNNREKIAGYERKRKATQREHLREYWRAYRRSHPGSEKAKKHRRRALLNNSTEHFSPLQWLMICMAADNRCLACGIPGKLTPDHVIPLTFGGSNHRSNIQPLCLPCNQKKATAITDYRYADVGAA